MEGLSGRVTGRYCCRVYELDLSRLWQLHQLQRRGLSDEELEIGTCRRRFPSMGCSSKPVTPESMVFLVAFYFLRFLLGFWIRISLLNLYPLSNFNDFFASVEKSRGVYSLDGSPLGGSANILILPERSVVGGTDQLNIVLFVWTPTYSAPELQQLLTHWFCDSFG